jgi:hyperosmotically inducible protein
MRSISNFLILAIAIISFSFVSANAQTYSGSGNQSTRTLEQQIQRKLLRLPNYGLFDHITYQVNGSTVFLTGKVLSLGTRKSAERVVAKIPGVEHVVNNIRDLPPSSFDDTIRRDIIREFAHSGDAYSYLQGVNPSVRIIVENGHVSLEGFVNTRSAANTMNILANGVSGVFSVTNHLIVDKERVR